jgi:hypothetical protein
MDYSNKRRGEILKEAVQRSIERTREEEEQQQQQQEWKSVGYQTQIGAMMSDEEEAMRVQQRGTNAYDAYHKDFRHCRERAAQIGAEADKEIEKYRQKSKD